MMITAKARDEPPPLGPEGGETWRAWLLGACFSVVLAFGGLGFQSLNNRLESLEQFGSPPFRERVAAIEARQTAIEQRQSTDSAQVRDTMKRIEEKLDIALERLHAVVIRR